MNARLLSLALALAALTSVTAESPIAPAARAPQASYVRICKNSRGMPDRRACKGKNDPNRTQLAFNE